VPENTQTPAAGGVLTRDAVAALLLQPLEASSIFLSAGVRILDTDGGNTLRVPRLTGSTGGAWVGEAEPIPDDDVTFGELVLLPKQMESVKVISKVSDELLRQTYVALDSVLRTRLVHDVTATLDTAFLTSTVTDGTRPLGLLHQPEVQRMAVDGPITFDDLHDMITVLMTAEVDLTGARWMLPPTVFSSLRKTKSTDGKYLMQPDPTEAGAFRLLGFPAKVTSRLPVAAGASTVVLWVPSLYAVARDINPQVKILTERYADTGQVGIRVQARFDAGPMYPESVVLATGVTA
jgi:HK97 family phage major capsid protein